MIRYLWIELRTLSDKKIRKELTDLILSVSSFLIYAGKNR